MIDNGKVYIGTAREVDVYGLLSGGTLTAAPPQITPGSESFTGSVKVSISDTTPSAAIYYTTDGSTPTPGSGTTKQYTSSLSLTATTTVNTIATASGYANSVVASATYTLQSSPTAPSITTPPASQTVNVGQTATFTVVASGTAPLTYQWTKNSTSISGATSASYTTPATVAGDNGSTFKVTVTNSAGSATSSAATLTVNTTTTTSITYVQGTYTNPASATVENVTYPLAQGNGDLNVVVIGWADTTSTIVSVTDTSTNIYTLAVGPTKLAGVGTQAIYYAKSISPAPAGGNTVTVTFSQSVPYPDLRIAEYGGVSGGSSVDVAVGSTGNSAMASSGALTTTSANDILVAGGYVYTFVSGPGSGFTNRMYTPDGDDLEDELVPATGTYTATASLTASGGWVMQCVAFRPAAVGEPQAATPTFSPTGGTISSSQQITISDTTPGAAIYYTTNGTTPSVTASEKYSGGFTLPASATVEAMAVATGDSNSTVASTSYTVQAPQAATPTFSEGTGTYTGTQSVTLSDTTSGATIYYAINAVPTTSSTKYAGTAITVSSSETVEAMAVATGYTNSAVASATYTINPVTTSTITYMQGTYTNAASGNPATATYPGAQTAGDLNVVVIGWDDTISTISSVTDTKGNTYTLAVGPTQMAGDGTNAIYYAKNIAGATAGTNTVKVTFNQTVSYPDLRIVEYSGADTVNPLDAKAVGTGSSATASSGALTTTSANDILVAGGYVYTFVSGPGSGFTNRMYTPDGDDLEDELVPATGTYTATASLTASGGWVMQCVAFRPAAVGEPQAATPTFSPTGGTISSSQQITISDTTPGAAIYYTTNGTTPSVTASEKYSGGFTLPASATVEAMAVATGDSNSTVASTSYTVQAPQAATPTFSKGTGTYTGTQSVTLSDTTSGATIYYAINAVPTTSSTKYAGTAITVSSSETVEAMAVATGYTNSAVASATYTINPVTTSTITYMQGTYTNAASGNPATATYPGAQTAGDLNVVVIGWDDTISTISSVTDTKGNTYTLAVGPTQMAGDGTNAIYYAKNIAGATAGTNTVKVTFNQTVSYPDLRIVEYSGADTVNPLDAKAVGTGSSATASSGALTTTSANDILVAGGYVYTFVSGPGSGFTNRMYTPDGDDLEDELVPATGTYTATASLTASGGWVMQCVAFRPPSP